MKVVEKIGKGWLVLITLFITLFLGVIDYLTGFIFSFSLFYLAPISLGAWTINRSYGLILAYISALTWFLSNTLAGEVYSQPLVSVWNTIMRLGFYMVTVYLLTSLKGSLKRERELSRVDFITGITNSRAFYDRAELEFQRAKRHTRPFTVAYIDLDDFKQINDQLGHNTGDIVLKAVAETMSASLRQTDIFARLGGDEFILWLPETGDQAAQAVIKRCKGHLQAIMEEKGWKMTCSIGVVTFYKSPATLSEVVRQADDLMYEVKKRGKGSVLFTSQE